MDMGLKLEHVLRYLKNTEPDIQNWEKLGDTGRSTTVEGVLLNAGSFNNDTDRAVRGLVLGVFLLAKKCAALEARCQALETRKS